MFPVFPFFPSVLRLEGRNTIFCLWNKPVEVIFTIELCLLTTLDVRYLVYFMTNLNLIQGTLCFKVTFIDMRRWCNIFIRHSRKSVHSWRQFSRDNSPVPQWRTVLTQAGMKSLLYPLGTICHLFFYMWKSVMLQYLAQTIRRKVFTMRFEAILRLTLVTFYFSI